jgi:uncharacterized OsmC-like protein
MGAADIAAAFARTERVLRARPSAGDHTDEPALAHWEGGLRVHTDDGRGGAVATDLPAVLGGDDAGPSPGWLVRAGLAACLTTCIAAVAARAGVTLSSLEVEARGRSDIRGLLGLTDADGGAIDPGPRDLELVVRIAASGVSAERLRALVDDANALSPVSAALQVARPLSVSVETG